MTTTPDDLIGAARSYVGTKFHPLGRLPGVGLDCIGVIVCAAIACRLKHTDMAAYPMRPNGQLHIALNVQMLRVATAAPGDVLEMSFGGDPHHVALFTGETLIHAYTAVRKCVEQPMAAAWWRKVRGIYRFRELA